jgi:cysteine-rich repeat protein
MANRLIVLVLSAGMLGGPAAAASAQLIPGDVLIVDQQYGNSTVGFRGGVFLVETTGARSLLGDFNNGAQGPLGGGGVVAVSGVAVETAGTILATDRNAGTGSRGVIFRMDETGARTIVTQFGDAAQGAVAAQPTGLAIETSGAILVATLQINGGLPQGVIFRVDRTSGQRTVVSDSNDPTQGPPAADPYGMALEANGRILVVDPNVGTGGRGALFRVNQTTGTRTILSDFGDAAQGPLGFDPSGVAVDSTGAIWVVDQRGGVFNQNIGVLFRVDPGTGARTLVSDFSNSFQSFTDVRPMGVAIDSQDFVFVVDSAASANNFSGSLYRVNPVTGMREVLDDFGIGAPAGQTPTGVVVYSRCGDAFPDRAEECDDGNTVNGDGCSDMCTVEPGFVACSKRIANLVGTPGDDTIVGTNGGDVIHGLEGNDTLLGGGGRDIICGGPGDDTIRGGSSNDVMLGGSGDDVLIGGNGKDKIMGDAGDDFMRGGEKSDTCDGGKHRTGDTAVGCETVFDVP